MRYKQKNTFDDKELERLQSLPWDAQHEINIILAEYVKKVFIYAEKIDKSLVMTQYIIIGTNISLVAILASAYIKLHT